MARLIVKRKSEWINWARSVSIYVDGEKVGSIANGDAEEFQVSEGEHKLKARLDWCGSETHSFSVAADQVYTVKVRSYRYSQFFLLGEIVILVAHLIAQKMYGISYLFWFIIPFFVCSLYYITFGRNQYLQIIEDDHSLSF